MLRFNRLVQRRSTNGVGGLGLAGNKTFPPLQQMPGGSFFHVSASQCLHLMFILPMLLGVGFSVRYLIETLVNDGDMQDRGEPVRQRTVCGIGITMIFHKH